MFVAGSYDYVWTSALKLFSASVSKQLLREDKWVESHGSVFVGIQSLIVHYGSVFDGYLDCVTIKVEIEFQLSCGKWIWQDAFQGVFLVSEKS